MTLKSKYYDLGVRTDVGNRRKGKANQDAVDVILPTMFNRHPPVLILADGMGGHMGGEKASKYVIQGIKQTVEAGMSNDYELALKQGVLNAHNLVRKAALMNSDLEGMGSTVVAAVVEKEWVHLANVGDSRAFIFTEDQAQQISYDHSWVSEQVNAGVITEEEAKTHPRRNVLTMSISAKREKVEVFTTVQRIGLEQTLLLCSDGLWGTVSQAQIQAISTQLPAQEAADKLIDLANASGSPDNISVIIAKRKE